MDTNQDPQEITAKHALQIPEIREFLKDQISRSEFDWNAPGAGDAAVALAQGETYREAALTAGVTVDVIREWMKNEAFMDEIDRLTLMLGISKKAARLRIAKRVIRKKMESPMSTERDLLDWLKYTQGETDGINLNLTALLATIVKDAEQLAPGRPGTTDTTDTDDIIDGDLEAAT